MSDLLLAVMLVLALSFVVLMLTIVGTKRLTKGTTTLVGMFVGVLLLAYLTQLWGHPRLIALMPVSSLVILGNWFPFGTAFLAGITWTHGYGPARRRILFGLACYLMAFYSLVEPLMGATPVCWDEWTDDGTCRQTSLQSCSAAAAATMLRQYNVMATEREMAELCLTRVDDGIRPQGTNWQGLYRGLKLKTAGTSLTVDVFDATTTELLRDFKGPQILFVGINADRPYPKTLTEDHGWLPGVRHSVVLLQILPNDWLMIADPACSNIELWTRRDLDLLWLGRGVRLVRL